jgi:hypothetical protein
MLDGWLFSRGCSGQHVSRILGGFLLKLLLSRLGEFWLVENN